MMADRNSAEIFGSLFDMLAAGLPADPAETARLLWNMQKGYDFSPCQMECDDALLKLGLARELPPDPRWPDESGGMTYLGGDEWDRGVIPLEALKPEESMPADAEPGTTFERQDIPGEDVRGYRFTLPGGQVREAYVSGVERATSEKSSLEIAWEKVNRGA